jgi:hypothetical protein
MAATVFEHPWILLIIGAISLVRWLVQKGKGEAQKTEAEPAPPPPNQPIMRGGETRTEEERIRKFLEALGQPAGSAPPPKVTPRRRVEPTIFSPLPPLTTAPPPLPTPARRPAPIPPPLPPAYVATQPADRDFEVWEVARQTSSEPVPEVRRAAAIPFTGRIKLGTPQDLRTAIILREIFGPPRSLQGLDLTSGS